MKRVSWWRLALWGLVMLLVPPALFALLSLGLKHGFGEPYAWRLAWLTLLGWVFDVGLAAALASAMVRLPKSILSRLWLCLGAVVASAVFAGGMAALAERTGVPASYGGGLIASFSMPVNMVVIWALVLDRCNPKA